MRRSSKKKRDLHSFREIKRDLYRQQKLKREELRMMTMKEEKKRISLAFTLLCLAISFALFFGFYYLSQQVPNKAELKYKYDDRASSVSGDSSASQQDDDESKLTQEQKELKKKIVEEDKEKFSFNWTLDNFVELKVENGGTNNPTLEEVIAKYGKGSNVSFTENGLTLTYKTRIIDVPRYGSSGHPQEISLVFYDPDSNGKKYYLITKTAVYLDDIHNLPATKNEFVFKWKPEDMDTLTVGDSQHGKGGMTYQEVIERFGLPSELNIYGSGMSDSPLSLRANYRNFRNIERKYDSVTLIFKRQEDGSFYLANANSEFDKSW
ncbi:hypothetical protein QM360_08555 [Streptococcus cristatus]|uniref:hypothetical protein n=1 Tax=Streptococcus cristatus TaxID=45634 RepID=UPI0039C1F823